MGEQPGLLKGAAGVLAGGILFVATETPCGNTELFAGPMVFVATEPPDGKTDAFAFPLAFVAREPAC